MAKRKTKATKAKRKTKAEPEQTKPDKPEWKPGMYPGLTREQYEAIPAYNQSYLQLFRRSPAHARHEQLHPREPTPAMVVSSAMHMAILEPELFEKSYVHAPINPETGEPWSRRSNAGKDAWAEFEDHNVGKGILTLEQWTQLTEMSKRIWTGDRGDFRLARQLLDPKNKGHNEVCYIAELPKFPGTLCKVLVDRITSVGGETLLVDLKFVQDASQEAFERAIANYDWDTQDAFYLDVVDAAFPGVKRRKVLLAIEKTAPYGCKPYELDMESQEQGRYDYERFLRQAIECDKTGQWPGYAPKIDWARLPKWKLRPDSWEE